MTVNQVAETENERKGLRVSERPRDRRSVAIHTSSGLLPVNTLFDASLACSPKDRPLLDIFPISTTKFHHHNNSFRRQTDAGGSSKTMRSLPVVSRNKNPAYSEERAPAQERERDDIRRLSEQDGAVLVFLAKKDETQSEEEAGVGGTDQVDDQSCEVQNVKIIVPQNGHETMTRRQNGRLAKASFRSSVLHILQLDDASRQMR